MNVNWSTPRGLVKISASWCWVGTNCTLTSFFWTWSLMKWCLTSMCFVLVCWTGFLARLMVLVLSQRMGASGNSKPRSLSWFFSHSTWAQQLAAAMYSASVDDKDTQVYFLLAQETRQPPRKAHCPLVLFLSVPRAYRFPPKLFTLAGPTKSIWISSKGLLVETLVTSWKI